MSWLCAPFFGPSRRREHQRHDREKIAETYYSSYTFQPQPVYVRRQRSSRRRSTTIQNGHHDHRDHSFRLAGDRHSPTNSSDDSEIFSRRHGRNQHSYTRRLGPNTRQFRLFVLEQAPNNARVSGQLQYWSLDHHPAYQALSYTWGNSIYINNARRGQNRNLGDVEIRLDGQAFYVAENLHQALVSLRQAHLPRYLWIDALCVNQNDVEEKNDQVRLMIHIYEEANSVIAWLGQSDRHSSIFMQLVGDVTLTHDQPLRSRIIQRALQNREFSFKEVCRDIFRRSYWYRTWIIQEIYSARRIILQCGHHVIRWKDLVEFQEFLEDECRAMDKYHPWTRFMSQSAMEKIILRAKRFDALNTLRRLRAPPRARPGAAPRLRPLAALLFQHWDALATDARDKVFAIMELASDRHLYNITVDYNLTVCQVYTSVVREYIRLSRSLHIILPKRPQNPAHNLPSWCPDWSSTIMDAGNAPGDNSPFLTTGRPYHASSTSEAHIDLGFLVHFSPCGQIMLAGGWRLGRVYDLSDVASHLDFQHHRRGLFDFSGVPLFSGCVSNPAPSEPLEMDVWYSIHRLALGRGFKAQLRRHLVVNSRRSYREYCKKKHNEFLRVLIRATTLQVNELIDPEILPAWRNHGDTPPDLGHSPSETMSPGMRRVLRGLGESNVHGGHKCFFITGSGLMGLAPNETRRGDTICILRGCDLPIVLRIRDDRRVRFVGACYVVGFMHGQIHGYMEQSTIPMSEEIFRIY